MLGSELLDLDGGAVGREEAIVPVPLFFKGFLNVGPIASPVLGHSHGMGAGRRVVSVGSGPAGVPTPELDLFTVLWNKAGLVLASSGVSWLLRHEFLADLLAVWADALVWSSSANDFEGFSILTLFHGTTVQVAPCWPSRECFPLLLL